MFMKTHKLFAAAVAAVFVLGSVAAFADDKTTSNVTPEEQAKMKADKDAAKAKKHKMTPEEKQAAKKAKHQTKQKEMTQIEKAGNPQPDGKDISKSAAATKSDPKALPDAKSKQDALKQQTKQPTGQ
jgi:hypothetical protein